MEREQGFTILELLISIIIVSLLSFLVTTNYRTLKENLLEQELIFALSNDLQFAKNLASVTNHAISICGSADGTQCNEDQDKMWRGWMLFFDREKIFIPKIDQIIRFHPPGKLSPFYIHSSANIGGGINIAPRRQYAYGMGRSIPNGRLTICHENSETDQQMNTQWVINVYGFFRTEIKRGGCR